MSQTMRVRMTTGRCWTDSEGRPVAVGPGEECTVDVGEAKRLLEGGQAEPVAERPQEKRGPGRPRKHPVVETRRH